MIAPGSNPVAGDPPLSASGVWPTRRRWYTPREVAAERRVRVGKVMTWIRRGELEAINMADDRMGKPRWKISDEALAAFDLARSSRSLIATPTAHRRRRQAGGVSVTEYFD